MSRAWHVRPALPEDLAAIEAIAPVARADAERRRSIVDEVAAGEAFVAVVERAVVGYLALEHSFFGRAFIALVCVHPGHRRAGVGTALVRQAEEASRSERIFVSTNRSNTAMQALLERLGYERSGVVGDLDPGDPELFYSRLVRGAPEQESVAADRSDLGLIDVVRRSPHPEPWAEGDNIPWHEPGFSERMLREHLSQDHDAASRRSEKIDRHVAWIHDALLGGAPSSVLDLGCGPGFYAGRLAALGHRCRGVDFSPASIRHARGQAEAAGWNCTFVLGDVRQEDFGRAHDLAMMLFGELNVFTPDDARLILGKARAALRPGASLLLEPHTFDAVRSLGAQPPSWEAEPSGLFADAPHLVLSEHDWHAERRATTIRHYVVEAATGAVRRDAQTMQAYDEDEYRALLQGAGFDAVVMHRSLTGRDEDAESGLFVITATARG